MENEIPLDLDTNGCLEMFGAAIRLAIFDFKAVHKYYDKMEARRKVLFKKRGPDIFRTGKGYMIMALWHYESAKHFLFSENGLESVIKICGLELDIEYVREIALDNSRALNLKHQKKGALND